MPFSELGAVHKVAVDGVFYYGYYYFLICVVFCTRMMSVFLRKENHRFIKSRTAQTKKQINKMKGKERMTKLSPL